MIKGDNSVLKVNGIYTEREYYGISKDRLRLPEPQFVSTLYWKPGVLVNEHGESEFSFFTGDITGKFHIVIQGVGTKDMIFGEGSFMVK